MHFILQFQLPPGAYMLFMINETFDSFLSSAALYFNWGFLVNNTA
jgi:hypothetical protein